MDGAFEEFDEELDERQADAVAAGLAGSCFVDAVEAVEDVRQMLGRDADAVVLDFDFDDAVLFLAADGDFPAFGRVFDGVVEEVLDDFLEEVFSCQQFGVRFDGDVELLALFLCFFGERVGGGRDDAAGFDGLFFDFLSASLK